MVEVWPGGGAVASVGSCRGAMHTLRLYAGTARHFRLGQIVARLWLYTKRGTLHRMPRLLARRYTVPREVLALRPGKLVAFDQGTVAAAVVRSGAREDVEKRLEEVSAGRFTFFNCQISFHGEIGWSNCHVSRLWLYNLHSFGYVWDLILAGTVGRSGEAYRCFRALATDWVMSNPIGRGTGWHSYPVALRIGNWIYASLAFESRLAEDATFRGLLLSSLYSQVRFLADHLEWDCCGNHLLEDARALLMAGLYFDGEEAARWLSVGSRIAWRAIQDQVLADGCHYERSPMYHRLVLKACLELMAGYRHRRLPLPETMRAKLRAMTEFALGLRHPDGRMPLFGDSAFAVAPPMEELLPAVAVLLDDGTYKALAPSFSPLAAFLLGKEGAARYGKLPGRRSLRIGRKSAYPDAGFFILGDGEGNALLLDGGEIGPDEVPAHGHCNTFGYELSVTNERVIVDSGVETYEPGIWRDFYRSTRAHNTLMLDGLDQSETWGAFRVARRARVESRTWDTSPNASWFTGAHDGFGRAGRGLRHRRLAVYVPAVFWLIADRVWGAAGEHRIESFVHLHPDFAPLVEPGVALPLPIARAGQKAALTIAPFGFSTALCVRGRTDPPQGWYAPQFGVRFPNDVLVFAHRGPLPHLCGYALALGDVRRVSVRAERVGDADVYAVAVGARFWRVVSTPWGVSVVGT